MSDAARFERDAETLRDLAAGHFASDTLCEIAQRLADAGAELETALRMHQVQFERANRLEAERDRLQQRIAIPGDDDYPYPYFTSPAFWAAAEAPPVDAPTGVATCSAEERIHRLLHYCDQELARRKDDIGCDPRGVTGVVPIRVIRTILEGGS